MNNHMSLKLVGANSSLELNSPITSIYLQEELTGLTTLPGIRETKGMNIGMNGGWTSAQFYEPRLITVKGVIANQDVAVVEQRRRQLIQLLAEKRLALEFQTEAGNHYTMDVVVAGLQMPLSKVLTATFFQLSLRADDPLIYDNNALAELEAILRRSSSASSGFTINFPINFQLGVSESRPTIDNFGSSVVYPVITLTGPLTTPEVVNITNNMAFTIDEVLGAGTYTVSGIRGAMAQEGTVETASGSSLQITSIEGAPLTLTEITGNATQNGTPTPDAPVAVNTTTGENVVKITGKNLSSITELSGLIWGTDKIDYVAILNALPIGTYTFSAEFKLTARNNTSDASVYGIHFSNTGGLTVLDRNGTWGTKGVGDTAYLSKTFTITDAQVGKFNHAYFYGCGIDGVGGTGSASALQIQLELGNSASSFEPYQGQGYTIDLGSIELAKIGNYQDRIYKTDGKWYIEKQVGKVVLDGTESWTQTTLTSGIRYYTIQNSIGLPDTNSDGTDIMSDYFVGVDYGTYYSAGGVNGVSHSHYSSNNYIQLFFETPFSNITAFKAWLASNPTTVYYALATPTTTEITDSTLLAQLNFIANLYGGTNNIMLVGTGAQGEIEVRTGQIIEVVDSLSIVGASGSIDIDLNGSELMAVRSVTDELAINGTTGVVTKTTRIGKIASYAGESITTDYISTTGGLDTGATVYYVLPSSSTSTLSTLDSTALATFNGVVAGGGVSAQTNISSISVDVTTVTAQDVAVVDTKQHTVTINGVGAYSKFSGDWLTLDVGLNELQLITENNTDTGSAVIKYRVGYMGV